LGLPIRTVCTVHNLGYQGEFSHTDFEKLGLPEGVFRPEGLEFYGKMNFLKGAIAMADAVTTVSPSYAQEIQGKERGHGLHEVLRARAKQLTGILNGIDMVEWNPAKDGALKKNFKWDRWPGGWSVGRLWRRRWDWNLRMENRYLGWSRGSRGTRGWIWRGGRWKVW